MFFLCFRPTMRFQGGSPVDPLFKPLADPPFDSTSQKLFLSSFRLASPPASYRSLSGPPGPKSPKSLQKVSRGQRVPKSLEKVSKCLFGTLSRLSPDFLGPRGWRPRETFFRHFGDFGARRARETPVARRRVRKFRRL